MERTDKNTRILKLYDRLKSGEVVNKTHFSLECNVSERAFDRDIEDIRLYLSEEFSPAELLFNKAENGYYLTTERRRDLMVDELLTIIKILLGSEVLRSDELYEVSETLMSFAGRKNVGKLKALIVEELANYPSKPDKKVFIKMIWDLSECVLRKTRIRLCCREAEHEEAHVTVSPLSVIFLENSFYLAAFIEGNEDELPALFRVEHIDSFEVLNQPVSVKSTQVFDIAMIKDTFKRNPQKIFNER